MRITRENFISNRETLSNKNIITQTKVSAINSKVASVNGLSPLYRTEKTKRVPFGSLHLLTIKLKKLMPNGKYDSIPASFIQLFEKDPIDRERILELQNQWGDKTKYGDKIIHDFLKHDSEKEAFFATEMVDPKNSEKKITCLMKTTNPEKPRIKRLFEINFIQASPDIVGSKPQEIIHSGIMGVFSIVRIANDHGFRRITVKSTNDKFYKKIGFKKAGSITKQSSYFELERKDFKPFLKKNEEKYSLNKEYLPQKPAEQEKTSKFPHFRLPRLIFKHA